MFLKMPRRLALTRANADDRLQRHRIDGQHHQRHQPVEPDHCGDQNDGSQHIAHQIIGKPYRRLAHQIEVIHDP